MLRMSSRQWVPRLYVVWVFVIWRVWHYIKIQVQCTRMLTNFMTRVNKNKKKYFFARLVMHKNNNKLSSHASLEVLIFQHFFKSHFNHENNFSILRSIFRIVSLFKFLNSRRWNKNFFHCSTNGKKLSSVEIIQQWSFIELMRVIHQWHTDHIFIN